MNRLFCFLLPLVAIANPAPLTERSSSSNPTITLPYANYQGSHNSTSGLDVFLGVRYAASTEGKNRWREAQPPLDESDLGIQNATVFPKQCPQATSGGFINATEYNPLQPEDAEDCLFVNVFKSPDAADQPVLVWIHGGSWDHNSAREFDPTPMINYSNNSFVAVIIQYRLGAFGFLNSPAMLDDNAHGLNSGISDAAAALRWVQKYIHIFGGNKDKVTIWGQSSGGGTIAHLLAAQGEEVRREEVLWRSAVLSSPYVVPMGQCNSSYWATQFHNFSAAANCTDDLECLRDASTDTLKTLSHQFDSILQPGHPSAYEPCIEGEGGYLVHNTAERLKKGLIQPAYIIAGNNYDDGSGFVSTTLNPSTNLTNLSAEADARLESFLIADFPLERGSQEVQQILQLYPLSDYVDNHARGAAIYQDVIFACPDDWILDSLEHGWRYLYAVGDAVHARDNAYEFPLFYNTLAPHSPSLYGSYVGSVISLILSSPPNPNTYSSLRPDDDPTWPIFETSGQYKVLNLTSATNVSDSYISQGASQIGNKDRCDFWAWVRIDGGW